jgi:ABC-type Mn2+/Zn2+ transport system ATPase subunit
VTATPAGRVGGAGTATPVAPAVRADRLDLAWGRELALRDASFECRSGEVTALVGPNGSGKSTLLHAVAGLLEPRAGLLEVLGEKPADVQARVAYTLQATKVHDQLPVTVREVVSMARYPSLGVFGRSGRADRAAIDSAMSRLEIDGFTDRRLDELSGGQRQRVFVAQGLAQEAEVLLLDEPVTGLDLVSRTLILDAIESERARGCAVLVTTHNLAEASTADRMLLLAGRIVAAGTPREVLTREHLQEAYGGRVLTLDEGTVLLDDPHHHAEGDDHTDHAH